MEAHCWFDYLYRDAGNWKTFRSMLLSGEFGIAAEAAIRSSLEWGDTFVPEQVEIPPLQPEHLEIHGVETTDGDDLDHAFHEFVGLRPATRNKVEAQVPACSVATLVQRFQVARGKGWDVTRSPFCRW